MQVVENLPPLVLAKLAEVVVANRRDPNDGLVALDLLLQCRGRGEQLVGGSEAVAGGAENRRQLALRLAAGRGEAEGKLVEDVEGRCDESRGRCGDGQEGDALPSHDDDLLFSIVKHQASHEFVKEGEKFSQLKMVSFTTIEYALPLRYR